MEQVLAEAARRIETETSWFETLGLRCEEVADGGGEMSVEAVLAFNVVAGLIDAANETVLAPVFVVLKELLGAVQGAAAAREDIAELIRYCVGVSRSLLDAAKEPSIPVSIAAALGEFKDGVEEVKKFVDAYSGRSRGWFRRVVLNSSDRATAAGHKRKLKDLLDAVLAGFAIQTNLGVDDVKGMFEDRDPPRPGALAEVPPEAPLLPTTFVQRATMLQRVVADLIASDRPASAVHCLLGMGGGGKTLMASSVVRDDRVRASFKDGVFRIPAGRVDKDVALLLRHLVIELSRVPTDTPRRSPIGLAVQRRFSDTCRPFARRTA